MTGRIACRATLLRMEEPSKQQLIDDLNEDLQLEFQSIVQYVYHLSVITGAEYTTIVAELGTHLTQELTHARVLAEQVSFLGGRPTTTVPDVTTVKDSRGALEADLELESAQLERYRERVERANEIGLPDVAEVLHPLLTQTQEHVRDLQSALGR